MVGSEFNLDLKGGNCDPCIKLKDPLVNLSPEYLRENSVQIVFVDKGKGKAAPADIQENETSSYSDDDSEWGITTAINESRRTQLNSSIIGESSCMGGSIGHQNDSSINTAVDEQDNSKKNNKT